MKKWTRDEIVARVERDFPDQDSAMLMAVLDEYGTGSFEQERERVQWGILELSAGDLKKVPENVAKAKRDFRDIVVWAERHGPIYDVLSGKKTMTELAQERSAVNTDNGD
ncbi:MAG: hypothetical protein ACR2JW_01780 [Thermomicrobiales bacterium]